MRERAEELAARRAGIREMGGPEALARIIPECYGVDLLESNIAYARSVRAGIRFQVIVPSTRRCEGCSAIASPPLAQGIERPPTLGDGCRTEGRARDSQEAERAVGNSLCGEAGALRLRRRLGPAATMDQPCAAALVFAMRVSPG